MSDIKYKTEQEQFWSGKFGDAYVDRNVGGGLLESNIAFFAKIFSHTGLIDSIIELGANRGINLQAIKHLLPDTQLDAVEINKTAYDLLLRWGGCTNVYHQSALDFTATQQYDLSIVKGVLIHISPEYLDNIYDVLYQSSKRWILIAEYYNPTPVEIEYRGHTERLFKRDFAGELMDRYPDLKIVDYGFVWHRDTHYPLGDTNWFLMEKPV
jgi:spore coat polysaccharide biosynthesis protein SpsF